MTIFDKSVQSVKFVNTITFKTKNDQLMKLYRHFLLLGTAIGLMMPGCDTRASRSGRSLGRRHRDMDEFDQFRRGLQQL